MKKGKTFKEGYKLKIIAMLLVCVMIFNLSGTTVLGAIFNFGKENDAPGDLLQVEAPKIIGEEVTKRTENEKHFVLEDGSRVAALYPEKVHYEENGVLKDIDNRLEETEDVEELTIEDVEELKEVTKEKEITKEENKVLENKANTFKAKFAKKPNKNKLGAIKIGNNTIKWALQNTNKKNVTVKKVQYGKEKKEDITQLENLSSSVIYENMLENIDINYDIHSESVKESIVLKDSKLAENTIQFKYNAGKLKMRMTEKKEIEVYDEKTNEIIVRMEPLFMYDAALEFSDKVEMSLEQKGKNYLVTIKPDKEWLQSKDRVYPVIIDPTINTSLGYNDIQDTFIYNGDTENYTRYKAHILRIGSNNKLKNPTRSLIKFNLPTLSAGDQIINATMDICNYPDTDEWNPSGNEMQIDVHKMTKDWNSQEANWNNTNANFNSKVEDYVIYKYDSQSPLKYNYFNITAIVKDWYTTGNNYGVMLKDHIETYNCPQTDAYFVSSDISGQYSVCRPMVQITYRNQKGLESYLSYHEQNVGRAGTVYTNDYNGNLVLIHNDAQTPGERMPASIYHVFNSSDKDIDLGFGKGFRLNITQRIYTVTIGGKEYAKYTDEDGTDIYFERNGTTNTYIDEDGLNLSLTLSGDIFTMQDKNGNVMRFQKKTVSGVNFWQLNEVQDTNGNKTVITYTTATGVDIQKIQDAAGGSIQFTYAGGKLSQLKDTNNRITQYKYDTSGHLTQIIYPDGKQSNYTYHATNNTLLSVKNIDNRHVDYEYYPEKTNRVKAIKEYGSANEIGGSLAISYGNNVTTFVNDEGYRNNYTFNNAGQSISISDFGKENTVNNAYGKMYTYGTGGGEKNKLTLEGKMMSLKEMPNNLIQNPYFDNNLNSWSKNADCQTTEDVITMENNKTLKFIGESNKKKYVKQVVNVSGKKGDIFNISGWIKTEGVPNLGEKSVRLTVRVIDSDASPQWIDILANTDSSGWQFTSSQFIADYDYSKIEVYLICYRNANSTYFDNIGLFKEELGQSYTYDKEGNIISTQDQAKKNSEFTYTGKSNLLSAINPRGGNYTYEYNFNNKNRLMKATSSIGTTYSFEYNNYGNTTNVKIEENKKSDVPQHNQKYYIKVASSNKYFDIAGASKENGGNLQQWELVDIDNQKFLLEDRGNGYFRIHPSHDTTKSLDLNTTNNNIQQWTTNNNDNQQWKFIQNSDGTYRMTSKYKGDDYCVALKEDSQTNSGNIQLEKWEGRQSQKIFIFKTNTEYHPLDTDKLESNEIYHIRVKSSNLYLEQQTNELGSKIIQNTYRPNDKKQLWRIVRLDNGQYKLVNLESKFGNVMDVLNGTNLVEQDVQMYTNLIPHYPQQWRITGNPTGTYQITTMLNGPERNLTVYWNSMDKGAHMVLFDNNGADNQKFYFEKANLSEIESSATYKIKNKKSGLFVGANSNGSLEIQNTSTINQEWIIKNLNNGYYKFILKNTNKVMDVVAANTANGTNIQIYDDKGNDAQQFELVPTTDGKYFIKPKIGKGAKTIEIAGGITTAGTKIQEWDTNETDSQIFELVKVATSESKKYIETKAEYSADGRYQTKVIDPSLNSVSYEYNTLTGSTSKITDAKGKVTNYAYDQNNALTSVSKQVGTRTYQNGYTYENDYLKKITHNGFSYTFDYDAFGNVIQTKVESQVLSSNIYGSKNGLLTTVNYGNNQKIGYEYDRFNRITKEVKTNGTVQYSYNAKSNLAKVIDSVNGTTDTYTYDLSDRFVKAENNKGYKTEYGYDFAGNVGNKKYTLATTEQNTIYQYDRNNRIDSIKLAEDRLLITNYDRLSRVQNKQIKSANKWYTMAYEYIDKDATKTTLQIKSITNGTNEKLNYTYDVNGNIETITKGSTLIQRFYYDEINQLTREDNKELNKTITYEYDLGGNITSKKEYPYTTSTLSSATNVINYTYTNTTWKDQLSTYNGKAITYDGIGNPLTYDGNTYTWQNGRQLIALTNTAKSQTIAYKYDKNGIRTQKTVNGVVTDYYLDGSKVIYEKTGSNVLYYIYDEQGNIIGFNYNNVPYYYIKNVQQDIIGILDNNLTQVASYTYDSWGRVIKISNSAGVDVSNDVNHIGNINPYRYRGYRYDKETNLYYLQSRYYNPEWGRFLNADNVLIQANSLLGNNLYAYCINNPVNLSDTTGNYSFSALIKTVTEVVVKIAKQIIAKTTYKPSVADYTKTLNGVLLVNTYIATSTKSNFGGAVAAYEFYNSVKNKGEWDYKRPTMWKKDIKEPFVDKFIFNGRITTPEEFGNIHYGFIGTALGFSQDILFMGRRVCSIKLEIYIYWASKFWRF